MDKMRIRQLHDFYEGYLFEKCLPFWLEHSLDRQNGGYLTCLDREGRVYNTDKSVWFQGRGTWLYSRLCNTVGTREDWMEAAKMGYNFLVNHCFDTDGRMFFHVTRDGKPLRKRRYFYSEIFAIIACAEYSRAAGDRDALEKAREVCRMITEIYFDQDKDPYKITPKVYTETRGMKSLAVPMALLSAIQTLREIDGELANYDETAASLVNSIFNDFLKADEQALFETVGLNG